MLTRILVAFDDDDTLEVLSWLLRKEGFRVNGARNALEALRQLQRAVPDVLVLYLDLPWISGWEVVEKMASDPVLRRLPTIGLTAGHTTASSALANFTVLPKPVSHPALLSEIGRLLECSEAAARQNVRAGIARLREGTR